MRDRMATFVKVAQANIVKGITEVEGGDAKFRCDHWQREQGGEGITCVLQDGKVFEKAAVNVSIVHGELPPGMRAIGLRLNMRHVPLTPDRGLPARRRPQRRSAR